MDGLEAARNIRLFDKSDAQTIPIIAMTANAFDEDVEKSHAAGMNAHLPKPIDPEKLFAVLFKVIDSKLNKKVWACPYLFILDLFL